MKTTGWGRDNLWAQSGEEMAQVPQIVVAESSSSWARDTKAGATVGTAGQSKLVTPQRGEEGKLE